jgi:hypothetical protein
MESSIRATSVSGGKGILGLVSFGLGSGSVSVVNKGLKSLIRLRSRRPKLSSFGNTGFMVLLRLGGRSAFENIASTNLSSQHRLNCRLRPFENAVDSDLNSRHRLKWRSLQHDTGTDLRLLNRLYCRVLPIDRRFLPREHVIVDIRKPLWRGVRVKSTGSKSLEGLFILG